MAEIVAAALTSHAPLITGKPEVSKPEQRDRFYGTRRNDMDVQRYHSIKVPAWVYTNWKQAELALQRRGTDLLPRDVLAPSACPACNGRMRTFEARYEYRSCERCGYVQQNLTATSNFLGGMVLGVGLTLLFKALSADNPPARRTRRPPRRRR